jgi:hypothetical protein
VCNRFFFRPIPAQVILYKKADINLDYGINNLEPVIKARKMDYDEADNRLFFFLSFASSL